MKYAEVSIRLNPTDPYRDLLVYALGDEGPYDSFVETSDGLKAYVPIEQYDVAFLQSTVHEQCEGCVVELSMTEMPDKDWNEEWERQHQPVLVEGFCWVRAPFHPHREDVCYEIEIEPKMSFGTAHHQTTYMMLALLRDEEVKGRRVLDMGSGTAVLAILAAKKGASYVEAIDNDEWAYRNALENVERNGCPDIQCLLGDAALLTSEKHFDLVIANINRNILLRDMAAYAAVLPTGGALLLSGFYEHDVDILVNKAATLGLCLTDRRERDGWQALRLLKEAAK
ncbi:MAG: 50S ribosomal protein L11 methyltransferase [Bacteroidales bacterium]|nr:50S ribosomal protein L11 methyltransferase [Bacteroidales bacterium]